MTECGRLPLPGQGVLSTKTGEVPFTITPLVREEVKAMKHTPKTVYRDSRDGQFVPKDWAKQHPAISEREIVYTPSPKKD